MPSPPPAPPWWTQLSPAAGACSMATGIISIGLHLTGHELLSRITLALAAVVWTVLAVDFAVLLLGDQARWRAEARTPAALTAVAATTVLGTRVSTLGRQTAAEALLALSAALWPVLLLVVVRHWRRRMSGSVFLACVATQGIAVLGATLAAAEDVAWPAHAALVLFWLGLLLYAVALYHFDLRQVAVGAGDQWVAGGALAISALAGAKLLTAAGDGGPYLWNDDDNDVLRTATVALLVLDLAWYCVLAMAEIVWRRPRYDTLRWSTVFPMGMTAAATLSVATAADVPWLRGPGQVLLWITVAVWLVVLGGAVRAVGAPRT
ncbi:hypothetical protein SGFS_073130 [Streptomyces graminofaciens]|uniref:Integral membrane protein n=1 Tax=Streptomyces graminofaciens TaxID=68212 RepID=A0ABM7FG38_9ACTN|nr:tellurite resistance/C4-dicarboxylate transporter family protein [Streptomyces graminofaciens]BBC36019.1 hypothetical protein SGFS_073130 [Streptomyces graminofaciens]